jgi:formate hydrogenlyase subunit 6/NADH:ubiquinone oxidoreductase subunit I
LNFKPTGTGIVKGMAVTLKQLLFRKPITLLYPEQKLNTSKRIRGNELIWDNVKCTGCATCARSCPQGAINISTSIDSKNNKLTVAKIEVDTGYCISCGLCVEACPYSALHMGYSYERAKYRREDLVQVNEKLLASSERPASAFMHPELEKELPKQTLLIDKIHE